MTIRGFNMYNNNITTRDKKGEPQMKKYVNTTSFDWDDGEAAPNYTTIDNYIFDNSNIEYNSQGIYMQIVRFRNSETHKVYMGALETTGKGSRRDIQRGILNLRIEGFLIRTIVKEKGKFKGFEYKIRRKPLELTLEEKYAIYSESKVNMEYTKKIYGDIYIKDVLLPTKKQEPIQKITDKTQKVTDKITDEKKATKITDETHSPCKHSLPTDCTNCVITNCEITNRVTYKENKKKEKISKKENRSLAPRGERENNMLSNRIEETTTITLSPAQVREVSKWDVDKTKTAIRLFTIGGGRTYAYLRQCYYNPFAAIDKPKKANTFSDGMYKHDWDLDELEKQAIDYMASTLKEETLLDW